MKKMVHLLKSIYLMKKIMSESLLSLIDKNYIKSAHDISLGGLITALSKMCIKGNKGIKLKKLKIFK